MVTLSLKNLCSSFQNCPVVHLQNKTMVFNFRRGEVWVQKQQKHQHRPTEAHKWIWWCLSFFLVRCLFVFYLHVPACVSVRFDSEISAQCWWIDSIFSSECFFFVVAGFPERQCGRSARQFLLFFLFPRSFGRCDWQHTSG